jgi:hypothetical protein
MPASALAENCEFFVCVWCVNSATNWIVRMELELFSAQSPAMGVFWSNWLFYMHQKQRQEHPFGSRNYH